MNQPSNVRLVTESRVGVNSIVPSQPQVRGELSLRHNWAGSSSASLNSNFNVIADSGHLMTYARSTTGASARINTGTVNGLGGFWCVPGVNAAYCGTPDLGSKVNHARMRFTVNAGYGGNQGSACLAITNDIISDGLPNSSTVGMAMHLFSTMTGWAYTVWVPGTGQVPLKTGTFSTPLVKDLKTQYVLEAWIIGNTAIFITPDGVLNKVTDSRISQYQGNYAYCESYAVTASDDVVFVTEFDVDPIGSATINSPHETLDSLTKYTKPLTGIPSSDLNQADMYALIMAMGY